MNGEWACLAVDVEASDSSALADSAVEALGQGVIDLLGLELPHGSAFRFEPQGVSLVRFGPAGRLALHTWPERNVATIDLWLRKPAIALAQAQLERHLAARHGTQVTAMREVGRGGVVG